MFTAIILMCSVELDCYTITNTTGYFETFAQCKGEIDALINDENFPATYMYAEGEPVYSVYDTRCINWNDTKV